MNRNTKLIIETFLIFLLNSGLAVCVFSIHTDILRYSLYVPLLLFQGLWLYRIYIVGHETAHKKLFPKNLFLNDLIGTIVLTPLLVPVNIYRKIHYFHHGFNRKDEHTSALDTFVVKGKYRTMKTIYFHIIWYLSIFCGGFFIHSMISVLLFLFIPPSIAVKISPAFKGWTWKDQFKAIALLCIGVAVHLVVYLGLGKWNYLLILGFPMLSFAWILSMLVYIFHYDTTMGNEVRYNVRSVERVPIFSWILMNFNEHATHHQYPNIPWYELPAKRKPLPEDFADKNQNTYNFFKAIFNQFKGPIIKYED